MPEDIIFFQYDNDGLWHNYLGGIGATTGAVASTVVKSIEPPPFSFIARSTMMGALSTGLKIAGQEIGWVIDNRNNIEHNLNALIDDINYNPNAIIDVDPLGDALDGTPNTNIDWGPEGD